jgi:hypothetical protein
LAADYLSIQGGYSIEVGGDQGAGVGWRDGRQTERGDCQELDLSIYWHSRFSNALQDGATGLNELARISSHLRQKRALQSQKPQVQNEAVKKLGRERGMGIEGEFS